MAKLKPIRTALLTAVAAVAVVSLGVMLWGDFVGAEAEQAAAKTSATTTTMMMHHSSRAYSQTDQRQRQQQRVPTAVVGDPSWGEPLRDGDGDGDGDAGGGDGDGGGAGAGGDGGDGGAEESDGEGTGVVEQQDEMRSSSSGSEAADATSATSDPTVVGSASIPSDEATTEGVDEEEKKSAAAAAGATDDPPPHPPVVVAKRAPKGAPGAPVDPSLIPRLVRDATGQQPVKNVKCVQKSLSTARPQEAGLNWDKATTTEDFFVHRQNRGPSSAMPPELLPVDAAAVMGKMKWSSCALVGNSAVLLSGKPAGSSIDAHDVVVRLNQAPTKSYTSRVGSKATWRILNKSWVVGYGGLLRREHGAVTKADLPNEKGVHMLASRGNAQAVKKLFAELKTARYKNTGATGVRMNFKLYDVISGQLKRFRACMASEGTKYPGGTTPSTGLMTALLLAGQCDELNLYGFGAPIVRGKYQY